MKSSWEVSMIQAAIVTITACAMVWEVIGLAQQPPPPVPPVTTLWFTSTIGPNTCRVSKVSQVPIRVSYVCFNAYGATAGSYTADITNGVNGTNYFYIGINSIGVVGGPTSPSVIPPDGNISCLIQMNGTAGDVMMVNGVTVPANGASYSCSGGTTTGKGTVTWP